MFPLIENVRKLNITYKSFNLLYQSPRRYFSSIFFVLTSIGNACVFCVFQLIVCIQSSFFLFSYYIIWSWLLDMLFGYVAFHNRCLPVYYVCLRNGTSFYLKVIRNMGDNKNLRISCILSVSVYWCTKMVQDYRRWIAFFSIPSPKAKELCNIVNGMLSIV